MWWSPNIYLISIIIILLSIYIYYSNFLIAKILVPSDKIHKSKKLLRNSIKYIYIMVSVVISLGGYWYYDKQYPNIIISIDSSLSMSATDLQDSRSEYISNLIQKSIAWLDNKFLLNSFDHQVRDIAKYIDSESVIDKMSQIKLWTGTALGDAIIFVQFVSESDRKKDILLLVTDGSANVWFDPMQALDKLQIPVILVGIYNTGYLIWTDQSDRNIYISSNMWFLEKILQNSENSGFLLDSTNQDKIYNDDVLRKIILSHNKTYMDYKYFYIIYIFGPIWLLMSLWLLWINFIKSYKINK